jgi:hypothetical protein
VEVGSGSISTIARSLERFRFALGTGHSEMRWKRATPAHFRVLQGELYDARTLPPRKISTSLPFLRHPDPDRKDSELQEMVRSIKALAAQCDGAELAAAA